MVLYSQSHLSDRAHDLGPLKALEAMVVIDGKAVSHIYCMMLILERVSASLNSKGSQELLCNKIQVIQYINPSLHVKGT